MQSLKYGNRWVISSHPLLCTWLLIQAGAMYISLRLSDVIKLTIIGSDNGLSPERRQAIIWTNGGILSIGPSGTNFNEISIKIHIFSFKKMPMKMSSAKRRLFCLGPNVICSSHAARNGYCYDVVKCECLSFKVDEPRVVLIDHLKPISCRTTW